MINRISTILVVLTLSAAPALADDKEVIAAMKKLTDRITELEGTLKAGASIPSGAVLAFDLPGGCPKGWSSYKDASGRFIVGTGGDASTTGVREFKVKGGSPGAKLAPDNIPEHQHDTALAAINVDGPGLKSAPWGVRGVPHSISGYSPATPGEYAALTSKWGKSDPILIDTMPPFFPLHFCNKDKELR